MAETAEILCPKCGATAEAGLIFCQKCAAVLKPISPLISAKDSDSIRIRTRSGKSIFFIFAVCAVIDFLLSYFDHRSVPFGVISAVGGLFGTAFYLFLFGAFDTRSK
jgi:hypothetical protein